MIYTYEHTHYYSVLNLLHCNVVTFQFINLRDCKWNEIWVIRCSSWIGSKIWSLFALPTSGRSPELGATSRHGSANTVQRKNLRVRKSADKQTTLLAHLHLMKVSPKSKLPNQNRCVTVELNRQVDKFIQTSNFNSELRCCFHRRPFWWCFRWPLGRAPWRRPGSRCPKGVKAIGWNILK